MVDASVVTSNAESPAEAPLSRPLAARAILAVLKGVGMLPFSLRSCVGAALGNLVGRLPLREATIASLQLQAFLPEEPSQKILPKLYANVGRSLLESLNLKPLLRAPYPNISCPQWDTIVSWTRDERPIIALTAHVGNWDLLAAYTIARGIPLSTVGKEARSPTLQVVLRSMREAYGIDTIWRSDKSSVKRIVSCFKERRVMAALIDQDTRVDSLFIPFFGTPAKTPSTLVDLGKRYNARFVSAFMVRVSGTKFEVLTRELDSSKGTEGILAQYHSHLEEIIRAHPDQWVWFHKRWRTDPSGTTLGTREYLAKLRERISARALMVALALGLNVFCGTGCFSNGPEHLTKAEELTTEGDPDEAIAEYRDHIAERLETPDRAEWENPHFYLLNIGDIELKRGNVDAALAAYEEAEREKVEAPLVADRYRAVASWYEERGELQKAIDILTKYRERDPLIFDSMLDRIARKLTAAESAK